MSSMYNSSKAITGIILSMLKVMFSETKLKNILIVFALFYASLQAAMAADTALSKNSETNSSEKTVIPGFYKDYKWDVGVIGAMTFDGKQTEARRLTMGAGLHVAYHLNESVTVHGEIVDYFKTFTNDEATKDATNRMYVASVAYDFSAERTYSLFAKAGLGYEQQNKYDEQIDSPISLMGFGFRYMFTDRVGAYVEGRWKYVLVNRDYPDNSLVGTIGVDYHFGLSDEKTK